MIRKSLKYLGTFLLVFLIVLLLLIVWLLGTNTGAKILFNQILPLVGVKADAIEGSVWNGLKTGDFTFTSPSIEVHAKDVYIDAKWSELWDKRAYINAIEVGDLQVKLLPTEQRQTSGDAPFSLPKLPVDIDVDKLKLGKFTLIQADGSQLPIGLGNLELSGVQWNGKNAAINLNSLEITHDYSTTLLDGYLKLLDMNNSDIPLDLVLNTHNNTGNTLSPLCLSPSIKAAIEAKKDNIECHLDLGLKANGTLKNLALALKGSADEVDLSADGRVNLFAPLILEQLKATFEIAEGLHVKTDVHSEMVDDKVQHLTADVSVDGADLQKIMPNSKVAATAHFETKATGFEQWQTVLLQAQLAEGSRWNSQPAQGTVDIALDLNQMFTPAAVADGAEQTEQMQGWALEDLQLEKANINLTIGKNSIITDGRLGQANDVFTVKANLPELSQLYPNVGEAAQVEARLKGSLRHHQLEANGVYTPGKTQELGDAPIRFSLAGDSQLTHILQDLHWKGDLTRLTVKHANYELETDGNLQAEVITKPTLTWQAGEALIHLKQPNGKVTTIHHLASSQKEGNISSKGEVKDLAIENSTYDANWDFNKNPQMNAQLHLVRQGGEEPKPLQKNPFANLKDLTIDLKPTDTADVYTVVANGSGEKTVIDSKVILDLNKPLVLNDGIFDIQLSDGTLLKGHATIQNSSEQNGLIDIDLTTKHFDLGKWSFGATPPAILNGDIKGKINLSADNQLVNATINAQFDDTSRWNKQLLKGKVDLVVHQKETTADTTEHNNSKGFNPKLYWAEKANINLVIGKNHIITDGAFGKAGDVLTLDINAPIFEQIYPGLSGGAMAKGLLKGSIEQHALDVNASYVAKGVLSPKNPEYMTAKLIGDGGWKTLEQGKEGWSGKITTLGASYQGFALEQPQTLTLSVVPAGENGQPEWQVGQSTLKLTLPGNHYVDIQQLGSTGKNGEWTTKGEIKGFVIDKKFLDQLDKLLGQSESQSENQRGGIIVREKNPVKVSQLIFDADWDIGFKKSLQGHANIVRRSGDLVLPLKQPLPLGLNNLSLKATFNPTGGSNSTMKAQLLFDTNDKGNAKVTVETKFNGLTPNLKGGTQLKAVGSMKEIAWASVFTDDLLSLGGAVDFDVSLKSLANGQWHSSGYLNGRDLKIIEAENGIRLLNGTAKINFANNKVQIDQFYFPSVIRITPKEWRTRQWIEENPPAQNGSLSATGQWDIASSKGSIALLFDHYPIIQRADRFAMMSGNITIGANLPKIQLEGKLTADAGWASVDISDGVPAVDGDVIVLKPGQKVLQQEQSNSSENMEMNLTVDLGPRFYLVGLGLNSGLVGSLTLVQHHGKLTAEGQFRTRGGAIEAYGQRLQIARGDISFGGNITNPTLNIEAVRRGLDVEAGLRVIGTAKKPKITLVSYPEVSEVEKLSWLIMGRGPDSSGADLALLFSVGSSLLGGEEPFYRQIGIDEIGVRGGTVGEANNILPKRTVADSTAYNGYDESNQLFYATKKFGDAWTVSVEQALTGSGTVVRGSYKLLKHLTANVKAGTINGLELLYKRVFKD